MPNVTTINPFEVPAGKEELALKMYDKFAAYFSAQPGYVSTKLYQELGEDGKFHLVSVSTWESSKHFFAALQKPELEEIAKDMPEDIKTYPSLYKIIRS